jgi:hypothetical protein
MLEHGVSERWPSRHCEQKWREMLSTPVAATTTAINSSAAAAAHYSSPFENSMGFAWMPFQ